MRIVQVMFLFTAAAIFFALSYNNLLADDDKPIMETLLRSQLEGVKNTEVIVSRVTLPPDSKMPKHTHPGEEFGYVIEGSITFWQEGEEEVVLKKGDIEKVSLNKVHSARTTEEGATLIVFRVHEEGKPERTVVEGE